MAFRFPLETILKLRRGQERAERLRLEAIVSEQRQTRARLEEAAEVSVKSQRRFQKELADGLAGSELQFQAMCQSNVASVCAALRERLSKLEESRLAQAQVLYRARQRREILDNLRLRQLEHYKLEQSRHEQQERDDLFLMGREISHDEPG